MKNKNELLRDAFIEADVEFFEEVTKQEVPEWIPSQRFEQKMERLFRRRKPSRGTCLCRCKWVACIILAFVLCTSAVCHVDALRNPVVDFFVKVYESFSFAFTANRRSAPDPNYITIEYLPALLPDGYQISDQNEGPAYRKTIYVDESAQKIVFVQQALHHLTFDTEGVVMLPIQIGSRTGKYFLNKGFLVMFWTQNNYSFCLTVSETLTIDEAVKIAESVRPAGNQP